MAKIPFGKYKGKTLSKVPLDYLEFLLHRFSGLESFPELAAELPAAIQLAKEHGERHDINKVADALLRGDISADEAECALGGGNKGGWWND